jgi:hypothetical protein
MICQGSHGKGCGGEDIACVYMTAGVAPNVPLIRHAGALFVYSFVRVLCVCSWASVRLDVFGN